MNGAIFTRSLGIIALVVTCALAQNADVLPVHKPGDEGGCEQTADVMVLVDTSESALPFLQTEKRFAADLVKGLAGMFNQPQLGVIGFGPAKLVMGLEVDATGDKAAQAILDMQYLCGDHTQPIMEPCNTPTDLAIAMAAKQFQASGRSDTTHIIFLITDGEPNNEVSTYHQSAGAQKQGILIVTIGVGLAPPAREYLRRISSQPASVYAHEDVTSFDQLEMHLPELVQQSCFYVDYLSPACGGNGTIIEAVGHNLFSTNALTCRFFYGTGPGEFVDVVANHVAGAQNTKIECEVPDIGREHAIGSVEVSVDGVGFSDNRNRFEFRHDGGACFSALAMGGVVPTTASDWWPYLFLLLIPLCLLPLFCWLRRKKTTKEQPAPVISAPAPVMKEVTLEAPPAPPAAEVPPPADNGKYKWKVATSAYIGFGKAKMDVDWAGDAPASAPHAVKRKKVALGEEGSPEAQGLTADVDVNTPTTITPAASPTAAKRLGCWARFLSCACLPCGSSRSTSNDSPRAPSQTQPMPTTQPRAGQAGQEAPATRAAAVAQVAVELHTPDLPPGWERLTTPEGHVYYENREQQITQWNKPTQ